MIAFSQPVRLGDYISVDDVFGTVEEIRFTYTYIRTPTTVASSSPTRPSPARSCNNYSMGSPGSMVAVDFVVPLGGDVERVAPVMLEVADRSHRRPAANRATSRSPTSRWRSAAAARLGADPLRRRELASDLRAAILRRLRDDGVLGEGADGGD